MSAFVEAEGDNRESHDYQRLKIHSKLHGKNESKAANTWDESLRKKMKYFNRFEEIWFAGHIKLRKLFGGKIHDEAKNNV